MGRTCESCGMPMLDLADFAAKNPRSRYCRYCTRPDGMLVTPQERKETLMQFIMEDEKLPKGDAEKRAIERMRKMPAWKGKI